VDVARNISAMQKYMPLGLLFGIFAACIHPISNFVTMNIDTRLGLETTASCLVQ
jgi:hypothetical protein